MSVADTNKAKWTKTAWGLVAVLLLFVPVTWSLLDMIFVSIWGEIARILSILGFVLIGSFMIAGYAWPETIKNFTHSRWAAPIAALGLAIMLLVILPMFLAEVTIWKKSRKGETSAAHSEVVQSSSP